LLFCRWRRRVERALAVFPHRFHRSQRRLGSTSFASNPFHKSLLRFPLFSSLIFSAPSDSECLRNDFSITLFSCPRFAFKENDPSPRTILFFCLFFMMPPEFLFSAAFLKGRNRPRRPYLSPLLPVTSPVSRFRFPWSLDAVCFSPDAFGPSFRFSPPQPRSVDSFPLPVFFFFLSSFVFAPFSPNSPPPFFCAHFLEE